MFYKIRVFCCCCFVLFVCLFFWYNYFTSCEFLQNNEVNQPCICICPLLETPSHYPPPPPSQPFTENQGKLAVLYCSFPLVVCFTHDSVYMSILIFQFISSSPFPCPYWHVHSLYLWLYFLLANKFICNTFFYIPHIYIIYNICFSLSELLSFVWQTLDPSTYL